MRVFAVGRDLVGIFVGQFLEAESAAACEFSRVCDRLRIVREQPRHFSCAFQVPLGIAIEPEAGLVDGAGLADAGENILQAAARRLMVEHVVGRDERNSRGFGEGGETMKPFRIAAMEAIRGGEIDAAFELRGQILQMPPEAFSFCWGLERIVRRHHRNDLSFRKGQEIFKPEMAFAFWYFLLEAAALTPALSREGRGRGHARCNGVPSPLAGEDRMRGLSLKNPVRLSNRQQPAKPSISRAVLGVAQEIGRTVHESQAAADDQLHVQFAGRKVSAHDAGKRVAVGDGDGGKAEFGGADDEFVRMRGPFQKGEVRRHLQFGITHWARHARLSSAGDADRTPEAWFWMAGSSPGTASPAMT